MSEKKRSFLFLQGPSSPLFLRVADQLTANGHAVHKIHFNSGDVAYWWPRKASHFRGKLEHLGDFIQTIWSKHAVTDQILFGNCRPVHRDAIKHAEASGIRTHVFEGGYFRPYWVTLEREGVNGHSKLPKNPDWYMDVGRKLPEQPDPKTFDSPFSLQATHDVAYHAAGISNFLFFPHYANHNLESAPVEYAGFLKRAFLMRLHKTKESQTIAGLFNNKQPYYLVPLQLSGDAQIIHYSDFKNMEAFVRYVMISYAKYAPSNSQLVIKNHPLDIGLVNYQKIISRLERELDIVGRTVFLEGGNTSELIAHAAGIITVNSTVGGLALDLGCPTITLADPIYNLPGLTFQGNLDKFWTEIPKPEPTLSRYFRKTVIYATQINGGLYCNTKLTAQHAAIILAADKSPLERCYDLL